MTKGAPVRPQVVVMETTAWLPSFAAIQRLPTDCVTCSVPWKTMSLMARMPRGERSSVRLTKLPAALLIRWVAGRPAFHIAATARSTASGSLMSTTWQVTPSPMAAAASCQHRAAAAPDLHGGPRESSFSAIIRPRPLPPPVTSTRWPANRSALNIAPSVFFCGLCCPESTREGEGHGR